MDNNLTVGKIIEVKTGDYKREWKAAEITSISSTFLGADEEGGPVHGLSMGVEFIETGSSQYIADAFGTSRSDWRFKQESENPEYKYFVSYSYVTRQESGFGNIQMTMNDKITGQADIKEIQDYIEKDMPMKNVSVIVLHWQQFEQ